MIRRDRRGEAGAGTDRSGPTEDDVTPGGPAGSLRGTSQRLSAAGPRTRQAKGPVDPPDPWSSDVQAFGPVPPLPRAEADDAFPVEAPRPGEAVASGEPFGFLPSPPPLAEEAGVFKPPSEAAGGRSFGRLGQRTVAADGRRSLAGRATRRKTLTMAATVALVAAAAATAVVLRGRLAGPATEAPAAEAPAAPSSAAVVEPTLAPAAGEVPAAEVVTVAVPTPSAWEQERRTASIDLPPAAAVVAVSWQLDESGTLVTIQGDGTLSSHRVSHLALADPPRELIRITGIRVPFTSEQILVGSPALRQIRIGHHPEASPPQLHVVLDLASPGVKVERFAVVGTKVLVLVGTPS